MTFSLNDKITIGAAIAIMSTLFGGSYKMLSEMSALRRDITALQSNSYTPAMAAEQALRMAIENPGMRVPDPRDPNKIIEVRSVVKQP